MTDDRDWLTVGAQVAEFGSRSVVLTTVERFTKTLVVLANGSRYPLTHLSRGTGGAWSTSYRLMPADAPSVVKDLRLDREKSTAWEAVRLTNIWRADPSNRELAVALRDHVDAYLAETDTTESA